MYKIQTFYYSYKTAIGTRAGSGNSPSGPDRAYRYYSICFTQRVHTEDHLNKSLLCKEKTAKLHEETSLLRLSKLKTCTAWEIIFWPGEYGDLLEPPYQKFPVLPPFLSINTNVYFLLLLVDGPTSFQYFGKWCNSRNWVNHQSKEVTPVICQVITCVYEL